MIFPPFWSELFLFWAFSIRNMLFKTQLEKELLQKIYPQAKKKTSVGVSWPTPKSRAILYLIYPYEDNGFITLGVIAAWVISHSDVPLPTSLTSYRKVKNHLLISNFYLQSLPPHVKHLSNAKCLPTCCANTERSNREKEKGRAQRARRKGQIRVGW